jgi:hypothetical protein
MHFFILQDKAFLKNYPEQLSGSVSHRRAADVFGYEEFREFPDAHIRPHGNDFSGHNVLYVHTVLLSEYGARAIASPLACGTSGILPCNAATNGPKNGAGDT